MPSQTPNSKFWSKVEAIGGRAIQKHDRRSLLKQFGWKTLNEALTRWGEFCGGDGSHFEFRRLCSEINDDFFNAPAGERQREPAIRALDVPVVTHDLVPMPFVDDSLVKAMPTLVQALVASKLQGTGICTDYAIASALTVVAGSVGNRVRFTTWGDSMHFTNSYFVLVGTTGSSRKSTVLKWVKQMLSEVNPQLLAADEGSVEALIQDLDDEGSRVWLRDEFSGLLAAIKGTDYLRPVRELLLSLYDHVGIYKRRLTRRSYECEDPCLTFLTTIQPEVMGEELFGGRNIDSGFVNRLLLVVGDGVDEWPRIEGAGGYRQAIRVKLAGMARGPRVTIDTRDCLEVSQQWKGQEAETFGPYGKWVAARASIQALKLAVLFEAADGATHSRLPVDWIHLACALLERWYKASCALIGEVHIKQPGERDRRDYFKVACAATHNGSGPLAVGKLAAEMQISKRQAETYTEDLVGRGWLALNDLGDPECVSESSLCPEVVV